MGIEIRPAAVIGQLEKKAGMLNKLYVETDSKLEKVFRFVEEPRLQGAGYDAAKERISSYAIILTTITISIQRTLQIDALVSGALSNYFGGCEVVSEDYWLNQQREAGSRYGNLADSLYAYKNEAVIPDQNILFSAQLAMIAAKKQQSFAKDMLSKIYAYCQETDGLYRGDLEDLNKSILGACNDFNSATFDEVARRWKPLNGSWIADMQNSMTKVLDAYFLEESRSDPEKVFLSSDMQHVYYNGEKWRIEGGSDSGVMCGDGFTQGWAEEFRLAVDYEHFDFILGGALFFNGFIQGNSTNANLEKPSRGTPMSNKPTAHAGHSVLQATGSGLEAAGDAMSRGTITFVFSRRGILDQKVTLYGSGDLTQYSMMRNHKETIFGFPDSKDSTTFSYLDSNVAGGLVKKTSDLTAFYTSISGTKPQGDVHISAYFDDKARAEEGYTAFYYFSDSGELVERVVRYNEDKVVITDSGGQGTPVDTTNEWFALEYSPNKTIKEKVNDVP